MNFSRHLSNLLYRVIHQTNLEARGETWTWSQGNSGIKKWTLECHWNTMINIKHSIMPLMAECNASSCCCVLDSLRNGVFYVFFLLLFGLWRRTLSFWRHVVLVWRALKTLNRSLWTLTGQCEYNSYASLNYISSIRRWTELDRLSRRNSLFSITIGQNGYKLWMSTLSHLKQLNCPDTNISCRASLSLV